MNAPAFNFHQKFLLACAFGAVAALGGSLDAYAAPLVLSKVPLYTNESVEPNFVLTFDDSGSMKRGYVPDSFSDDLTYFPGFPHVDGPDLDTLPDRIDTRCWWAVGNWSYSPEVNKIYYNKDILYAPPKNANGTSMPDRSFTSAPVDGIAYFRGTSTTVRNLSNAYLVNWELGGNANDRPRDVLLATGANPAPNVSNGLNCETADVMYGGAVDGFGTRYGPYPFGDARAFYYQYRGNDTIVPATCLLVPAASRRFNNACYTPVDMNLADAAQKTNYANWYSYYRTRTLLARTSLTRVFDVQQTLRVTWQSLSNLLLNDTRVITTISGGSAQRTGLFDFVQTNPANGGTPNRAATKRVGDYFGGGTNLNNDLNNTNPYYDPLTNTELSCRQNFHLLVTDGGWKDAAGLTGNFDATGVTLPDGKVYAPLTADTNIYSKEDANNVSGLADNAFYYWSRDLRPSLTNNVPASYEDLTVGVTGPGTPLGPADLPSSRPEIYFNPTNDPATWQHLVQYIVGFGVGGDVPFPSAYDSLRRGTYPGGWPFWVDYNAANPQAVDDTWHATINGRGEFFNVNDPQELIDSLSSVFLSIGRRTASNTPVSLSSGLLTTSTLGYQTLFDTSDWSGRVLASLLSTTPDTPEWDVACVLTGGTCSSVPSAGTLPGIAPGDRKIATRNSTSGVGVPFQFASLSTTQQTSLNTNPATSTVDSLGSQRLAYIRGERSREVQNGGTFRTRKNLLGAVVNSAALVPQKAEDYIDDASFEGTSAERASPYSVFSSTLANYNTLYFGANDGMLHAINSTSAATGGGNERWAYIPSTVFENLNKLTSPTALQFQSYVDATPQVRDVFYSGAWHRVLVGGLRLGGQGIYALDVTNPIVSSEGEVAAKVLWEFSDKSTGGANLGFTYGNPFITRLASGDWVALVPGGYNSEVADGSVGDGFAHLFVLRIRDGAVLKDFNLTAVSRGLSSVIAGDYRVSGDNPVLSVSDVAFAGDLNGNIWRFNLEGATPGTWTFDRFFTAPANQSITVQPRLVRTAYEDVGTVRRKYVVTFGTGKYIENTDRSTTYQQAYYGVYDQGPASASYPLTQANLQPQTLSTSGLIRRLSTTQVPITKRGWYFNFLASGERNIAQAVVRNVSGTLIFTTLAPLSTDPCAPAAESYLMFTDATTGGVPGTGAAGVDSNNDGAPDSTDLGQITASFDSNRDGRVDTGDDAFAAGIKLSGYIAGVTPISSVGGGSAQILIPDDGSGGAGSTSIEIANYEWRRRSWRELINE